MLQTIRISWLLSATGARWRSLAGLGILLASVLQAVETHGPFEPAQLEAIGKDATASEIQRAIRTVFAGEALLDPSVQRRLLERSLSAAAPPQQAPSYPDGLTQREIEVLREIAAGHSNQEIADRLSISEATVKTHVNNIFSKAHLRDRAQAVVYAIRHELA